MLLFSLCFKKLLITLSITHNCTDATKAQRGDISSLLVRHLKDKTEILTKATESAKSNTSRLICTVIIIVRDKQSQNLSSIQQYAFM